MTLKLLIGHQICYFEIWNHSDTETTNCRELKGNYDNERRGFGVWTAHRWSEGTSQNWGGAPGSWVAGCRGHRCLAAQRRHIGATSSILRGSHALFKKQQILIRTSNQECALWKIGVNWPMLNKFRLHKLTKSCKFSITFNVSVQVQMLWYNLFYSPSPISVPL